MILLIATLLLVAASVVLSVRTLWSIHRSDHTLDNAEAMMSERLERVKR